MWSWYFSVDVLLYMWYCYALLDFLSFNCCTLIQVLMFTEPMHLFFRSLTLDSAPELPLSVFTFAFTCKCTSQRFPRTPDISLHSTSEIYTCIATPPWSCGCRVRVHNTGPHSCRHLSRFCYRCDLAFQGFSNAHPEHNTYACLRHSDTLSDWISAFLNLQTWVQDVLVSGHRGCRSSRVSLGQQQNSIPLIYVRYDELKAAPSSMCGSYRMLKFHGICIQKPNSP